ncbi:MAG: hypothetical protein JRJ47_08040 [Deltaproteobacteria bacterium]|nr:hypothetical protein [Deltaproteobacteria bacterium]
MTSQEARVLAGIPPKYIFTIQLTEPSDSIEIQSYILSSGDYRSDYFLAFKDNKLIYWGYPHEFARVDDPYINEIGEKGVIRLKEMKPEQKSFWKKPWCPYS